MFSEPNGGSCVEDMAFTAMNGNGREAATLRTPVQTEPRSQGDVGVLVVDDQPVFRSAASAVVQSTPGFTLMGQLSSGEDAIEFVREHAPNLVLLDVRMPKLDGVATARLIARIATETVTVLMSADERSDIAADPDVHGAAAFVGKAKLGPRTLRELWTAHRPTT
jgi:two-component system, NarL family, invasion response regulator UvrY